VDYQKELKNKVRTEIDSGNGEPLQVKWNGKFKNDLYASIPKSIGFFNQN
jgi:hypothetical protein